MQKHLPTIIVSVATLVILACLHLFVFAPMHREYAQATEGLRGGVEKLKSQINEVDWNIPKPDPRDPGFTWDGLLSNVKGNYDGKLAAYQNLVEDIDISLPADEPEKSKELVLTRLASLQELERQNGRRLRVADKWGVNTWSDSGHNGTRPLDLTLGGYVSYAGEGRIDGKQGTISFAINVTPWAEISEEMPKTAEEIAKRQSEGPQTQVLFHAGKVKPPEENAPKGAPTEYSSEIMVQREGYSLNFIFKKFDLMEPIAKSTPLSIGDWFDKKNMGNPWKVIRFSWGPSISDMQIFIDGKSATEFNMTAKQPMAAGGMPGMGMMGMGMMGMGMMGMNMMGGREGYGGGMSDPTKGVSLETFDAFTIGCDLQYKNSCPLMYDTIRIWNTLAKSGEPQSEPLFQEDFEAPFGSDTELKRSIEQMTRFLRESYDPQNKEDVRKSNKTKYEYMNGFWGISPGLKDAMPEWISTMKTLAFLDHAAKVATKSGDPERLAREINITIPEHSRRRHVATFLDLAVELANTLLSSQVDNVSQIDFLTWSNTVNDEPLKAAYKEAFDKLEADVGAAGGMMKGPMGMMGMGMMGMGMMGGGMMYGGMAGMGPPGMMGPGMMPGMYGPPGLYAGTAGSEEDASDPEALKRAEEERNQRIQEMQQQMEEQFKKIQEYESNREKWQRWVKYNKKNEIPPEFYTEYQSQMSQQGKDFFLRYSLQTTFECSKDRLAPTLHAIEFGKRLAFISKVRLTPVPETTSQIKAIVNVEYNFMMAQLLQDDEETPAEGTEPPAEGAEDVQTSDSGGAG